MPMIFNPLLEFGFEEKDDIRILMKDSEGNEIDITDYVANLNQEVAKKVNIFQGSNAGNKVMVTDAQGNVTHVAGVVMNQNEREKLAAMTNPMLLKGIVESYEALYQIANPQVGWTYLVPFLENGENIHKEYVYTASNRWELIGNFNMNMIQHYYSGKATEIDNAHNVNILFNPDTFEVDSLNRLNIKDFSYVRKCTQQSEINAVEIGSIFHWQGNDNQSIIVEDTNSNQTYIKYGYFYKKEADKIVLVNKEPVKDSLAVDVNVSTWSEFITAVRNSATIATRIHFIANITVTSAETLDLTNCMIYGHYNRWIVNGITTTLTGTYAYFNNVLIQGANSGSASTPMLQLRGESSSSCQYIFDSCRIFNFLETGNAIFASINGYSSASIHIVLHLCSVNGESSSTKSRVLQINNGGSGYGVTLRVINLIHNGLGIETNKVGIIGVQKTIDFFYGDGSVEYSSTYKPDRFVQWGKTYSYNDLTDKPTIGEGSITLKKRGSDLDTFNVNQTTNKEITIPNDVEFVHFSNNKAFFETVIACTEVDGEIFDPQELIDNPSEPRPLFPETDVYYYATNTDKVYSGETGDTEFIEVTSNVLVQPNQNTLYIDIDHNSQYRHDGTNYVALTPSLANVAFSGSYNDLINTPTQFSGNYNDLSNKPLSVESNKVKYTLSDGTTKLTLVKETDLAWTGTLAQYNAITTKNPNMIYLISD